MKRHGMRMTIGLVAILAVFVPAQAEVGANLGAKPLPYVMGAILDDPSPFGLHWQRFSPTEWSHRVVLNEQGYLNNDGRPAMVVNPVNGWPIVAWAINSPTGYDIAVSHFVGGTWSTPQVVSSAPTDELDAALAVDPSTGQVHLFYWVDGAIPQVMHREAPADLSSWSVETPVSNATDPACRPSGTVHEGVLYVSYEVHHLGSGQTPRQVVLASKQGGQFVEEVVAITYHAEDLWPEVHYKAGKLWVEWIDSSNEMAWSRADGQGGWDPTRYESYTSQEDLQFHVRRRIRVQAIQP